MQRHIAGESIREIAREEGRDRATVTKIVRSEEMQVFVQKMRERFYGLAFDAMNAVEYSLQKQPDGRLGYQLLRDVGVVPTAEQRYEIATQPPSIDKSTLSPLQIAMAEDENGQINRVRLGMSCVIEEGARVYGVHCPTAEEYRRSLEVFRVIEEITEGRYKELFADGPTEKRIRKQAEEIVKRREARKALSERRAQKALPPAKPTGKSVEGQPDSLSSRKPRRKALAV